MDSTFIVNLQQEFALPEKGILSRMLQKDDFVNVMLFGFSTGRDLADTPRGNNGNPADYQCAADGDSGVGSCPLPLELHWGIRLGKYGRNQIASVSA